MPTILDSLYFTYDGISCKTYKLMNVNLSNGMYTEKFHASREIVETTVKGSDTPLFHSVEESPREFELNIAFTQKYTDTDIDNVVKWLFQDNYKPLYFEDKPNKIYYCMPVGDSDIVHNGLRDGYITITMRCRSSKILSPLQTTPTYDLSTNTAKYRVNINNTGHVVVYPEISIEKVGAGNITFTKGGEIFEIRNLTDRESIYINCEKEIIQTDAVGVYRFGDVVGDYFDMALNLGNNAIDIEGKCKVTFRYYLKFKF
jgi:phage-related protein